MSPRRLSFLVALLLIVGMARARTTGSASTNGIQETRKKPNVAGYLADIRLFYKLYEECSAGEFINCLKKKMVVALDRAGKAPKHIPLMDGVVFVRDRTMQDSAAVTEKELEIVLPRSLDEREVMLNEMIFEKIIQFFRSHTLEFKLFDDAERSVEEGRGRRTRLNALVMVPLLLGGTLIPLAFGALALLAGKALIISKLALALAAIIGLKKLIGTGVGESYQVVSVPHHGAGHYKRSLEESAHDHAYSSYAPDQLQGV